MYTQPKRNDVIQWYIEKEFDIILTQEAHCTPDTESDWKNSWGGDIIFSHGTNNARGTCIFIKHTVQREIFKKIIDPEGRYVILDIELEGVRLTLASIYAPNNDSPEYFEKIRDEIESIPNDKRIVGGDYNLILDLLKDKKGGTNKVKVKSQKVVSDWMENTDLVDIYRYLNPDSLTYTWSQKRPTRVFCRLDFFLISQSLVDNVSSSKIIPGFKTDHSVVTLDLSMDKTPRGRGYWKLNCSHLSDPNFVQKIKQTITETANINRGANPNLLWDTIKMAIRGESIKYSSQKKKETNNEISRLENEIQYFEQKQSHSHLTEEQEQALQTAKSHLSHIINEKAKGAYVRSRSQNYEEGERNSSSFFNIEKRSSHKKSINKLRVSETEITKDQTQILGHMKDFYRKLYSKKTLQDADTFLNSLEPPNTVSEEQSITLKKELSINELETAIKEMKSNKSPGKTGCPLNFTGPFGGISKTLFLNLTNFHCKQNPYLLPKKEV